MTKNIVFQRQAKEGCRSMASRYEWDRDLSTTGLSVLRIPPHLLVLVEASLPLPLSELAEANLARI
jgi:hypothetical protein